jgi:hypothetical protein
MAESYVIEYEIREESAEAAAEAILALHGGAEPLGRMRPILIQFGLLGLFVMLLAVLGILMGQPWWFFVVVTLLLVIVGVVFGLSFLVVLVTPRQRQWARDALGEAFRRLESPHVRWTLTRDLLTVQAGRDVREIRWEDVKEVGLTGTFWVLAVNGSPHMLFPGDRLPKDAARFLLEQARNAGAEIRVAGGSRVGDSEVHDQ